MYVTVRLLNKDARIPERKHIDDAGLDVFMPCDGFLVPGANCVPLGISIDVPKGYMANIYPRSSMNIKGITALLAPIDSGYTGEIHLLVFNTNDTNFHYKKGDRLGQLIFHSIAIVTPVENNVNNLRGCNGLGSTGN